MEHLNVEPEETGARLDTWLSRHLPDLSRTQVQNLIKAGHVRVDGKDVKPRHLLHGGEDVSYEIPPPETLDLKPEPIPLDIQYEDADLLVLNKQPGLVVHPAPGHTSGTLVNALLFHCRDLSGIGRHLRPGIVHRLDRDTSGVMVVAKNDLAMHRLSEQFKQREVRKTYLALVWGHPEPPESVIETSIGRNPHHRKKMSVHAPIGRRAVTRYETLERLDQAAWLRIHIETGRTHQIRVHMAHLGHGVIGDAVYGRAHGRVLPVTVSRQMLHAETLSFTHPRSGDELEFSAPVPADMRAAIQALRPRG